MGALLEARGVSKRFMPRLAEGTRTVAAVSDVSLNTEEGKTLGIVGESGSGKTTLARILVRLLRPDKGEVLWEGKNALRLREAEARRFCRSVQIIFQDPLASLNPLMRVEDVLKEPLAIHRELREKNPAARVTALLEKVGLKPEFRTRFPHALSGGERQRVAIARALAVRPRVLVCDEAVSSLDVLVQAQILNLLLALQKDEGLTYVFISHDLRIVKHMSDTVAVMERGKIVEEGPAQTVLSAPQHPYTRKLLDSTNLADL